MRVLAIHRYYWPDTPPYASLLRSIVRQWTDDGHDVEVIATQPSYKPEVTIDRRPSRERVDGADVRRIALKSDRTSRGHRAFNVIAFPMAVASRIVLGRRRQVVMCSTAPPVVLGYVVSAAARLRGARFVFHCMDLHPEIGALSGEFRSPYVRWALMRLDLATCRRAAAIVVLSEDMKRSLVARDESLRDRIVVLNNFELPDFDGGQADSPLPPDAGRMRVAFTGNIGRFQGLEAITEAVLGPESSLDRVELVFMGEGGAKAALEQRVADAPRDRRDRVRFVPHGSPARARALLRTCDLGLVSLTPDVIRYAYPSKTATYLSEGLPLLAQVEPDSDLAELVTRTGVGRCLTGDVAQIRATLLDLVDGSDTLPGMAASALRAWKYEFAAAEVLPRWSSLLGGIDGDAPGVHARETVGDVVIIGAPRSGTNMLRDLLTAMPEFTTWDCDEINLTWRHGNRSLPDDELAVEHATGEVRAYLRTQFDKVRSDDGHRVIEKTCANSLRVPFVHAVKPDAKFVFITRDGLDVVPSAMLRWNAPLDLRYTLAKARYVPPTDLAYYGRRFVANQWRRRAESATIDESGGAWWGPKPVDWRELVADRPLDEVCMVQWQRCVDSAASALDALPATQVHLVRYEAFVADPAVELRRLLTFLGSAPTGDLASLTAGVSATSVGRGRASLSDEARTRLGAIGAPTLERLGYDI